MDACAVESRFVACTILGTFHVSLKQCFPVQFKCPKISKSVAFNLDCFSCHQERCEKETTKNGTFLEKVNVLAPVRLRWRAGGDVRLGCSQV